MKYSKVKTEYMRRPAFVTAVIAVMLLMCVVFAVSGCKKETAPEEVQADEALEEGEAVTEKIDTGKVDKHHYDGVILEKTKDMGKEYADETLFVGDSNTYRYMMYDCATLKNCIGIVGMGVREFPTEKCVKFKGKSEAVTVPEAIAIYQPRRIVLCFGTNDTALSEKDFRKGYSDMIDKTRKAYPYADIILSAIPPVAEDRDYTNVSMKTINAFNKIVLELAKEKECYFLDSNEVLLDEKTGYMIKGYHMVDGIHLDQKGTTAYFEYFRTHGLSNDDMRPDNLKKVPDRDETEPHIIENEIIYYSSKIQVGFFPNSTEMGYISGSTTQIVRGGRTCSAVKAVAKEGYKFSKWKCSSGSIADVYSENLVFEVPLKQKDSISVVAEFEPDGYSVSVKSDIDGCYASVKQSDGSDFSGYASSGQTLRISVSSKEGYKFDGFYYSDGSPCSLRYDNGYYWITVSKSVALKAVFKAAEKPTEPEKPSDPDPPAVDPDPPVTPDPPVDPDPPVTPDPPVDPDPPAEPDPQPEPEG